MSARAISYHAMTNQITEELVYWGRADPPTGSADDDVPDEERDEELEPMTVDG